MTTLIEYAEEVADWVADCAEGEGDVQDIIERAEDELLDYDVPNAELRWFWSAVIDQVAAQRPLEMSDFSEHLSGALAKIREHMG